MNIIELVRSIVSECPLIDEFTNGIHVDFTSDDADNYGIASTGDTLVKIDVLGNQLRQHNFVLYANNQAISDFERLRNSSFILKFGYYLEEIVSQMHLVEMNTGTITRNGKLLEMKCSNGMAYAVSEDGQYTTYQLQIAARYKIMED